jgi:DNA-binding transcriptional regulator YdaS (Cro superfamily)
MAIKKRKARQVQAYIKRHNLTQGDFGRKVGVSQGMVWQWINGERAVSPRRARRIYEATNGEISLHELCPDVFPIERQAA